MKLTKKIQLFFLAGIVSVLFASCQNEESELIVPNAETLSKSTPLTTLLERVSMTDPTTDNIIDSTDCFKVKLPVEVLVNNQPVLVTSEADFAIVEATFTLYPNEYNTVEFVFPITVIYPDNSEVAIGSQSVYDIKAHECDDVVVPIDEQPVSCLSIVYPITLSTYDSEFQIADSFTLNSDSQLLLFLAGLGSEEYYAIGYPMSVINNDGETIVVNNNSELWTLIIQAIEDCASVEPPACDSGTSYFQVAYESLKGMANVDEMITMDLLTHEYKFELVGGAYKTICTVGYQGEQSSQPVNYTIEIEDQLGNIIYTTQHAFSSTQTEYIGVTTLGSELTLAPGVVYTIRRIVQPGQGMGIGRLLNRSQNQGPQPPLLPFQTEDIKILESKFYGSGGSTDPDLYRVPFIDIVFKN